MYLFIDTTDPEQTTVGLLKPDGSFVVKNEWEGRQNQSEDLVTKIDELLNRQQIGRQDLTKIVLINGPGSYTGLRVGLASGNALAYALGLPAVGIQKDVWQSGKIGKLLESDDCTPVRAFYLKDPHITKAKHRQKMQNSIK